MRTTSTAHGSSLRLLAHAATAIGLLCLGFGPTGAVAYAPVIDNAGALKLSNLPEISAESGTFVVVASPGTPSSLLDAQDADVPLASSADYLICRGATLLGTSEADRVSLGTCSLVAGAIVLDGVTDGDLQAGLADSRHGRTLTALFRARLQFAEEGPQSKQTLIFSVQGEEDSIDNDAVVKDVHTLFQAVSAEREESLTFEDCYDIFITSADDKSKVLSLAASASKAASPDVLSSALVESYGKVKASNFASLGLDTPSTAKAFVEVGNAFGYYTRVVRAKLAAWKSRVARGLLIDDFGSAASDLRQGVLEGYDTDTISGAGLPSVADYRVEMRGKLQAVVESGISEVYSSLQLNLEKKILKRFNSALLKTMNDPAESVMNSNTATLRRETFAFEKNADNFEVPALGLTKERAIREFAAKLNDSLMAFPDSPAAKIKRTQQTKKVVSKEKKPGQRSVDLGLDLVAMLRPDGFGSLQGFCGYQLGGNSLTFGVHNDADSPDVIQSFNGVRPPLLRVQPKLRVDVEL